MKLCNECLRVNGHHAHCSEAEDMPEQTFVLWFSGGCNQRKFFYGEKAMRRAAKQYDFDADDVMRFGEVDIKEDGILIGGCYADE